MISTNHPQIMAHHISDQIHHKFSKIIYHKFSINKFFLCRAAVAPPLSSPPLPPPAHRFSCPAATPASAVRSSLLLLSRYRLLSRQIWQRGGRGRRLPRPIAAASLAPPPPPTTASPQPPPVILAGRYERETTQAREVEIDREKERAR